MGCWGLLWKGSGGWIEERDSVETTKMKAIRLEDTQHHRSSSLSRNKPSHL